MQADARRAWVLAALERHESELVRNAQRFVGDLHAAQRGLTTPATVRKDTVESKVVEVMARFLGTAAFATVAVDGTVDKPGIDTLEEVISQAQASHDAGPKTLEEHIIPAIGNAAQAAGSGVDGLIDAHPSRVAIALLAHKGMLHAPCIGHGLVARTALRAQATKVAWVLFVSGYFDDEVVLHLHHNSAANPTVRTHAAHGFTGAVIRHLATSPGIS